MSFIFIPSVPSLAIPQDPFIWEPNGNAAAANVNQTYTGGAVRRASANISIVLGTGNITILNAGWYKIEQWCSGNNANATDGAAQFFIANSGVFWNGGLNYSTQSLRGNAAGSGVPPVGMYGWLIPRSIVPVNDTFILRIQMDFVYNPGFPVVMITRMA